MARAPNAPRTTRLPDAVPELAEVDVRLARLEGTGLTRADLAGRTRREQAEIIKQRLRELAAAQSS